jgi:hypothetical protein
VVEVDVEKEKEWLLVQVARPVGADMRAGIR